MTISYPWHNDFNSSVTKDCQRKIREWAPSDVSPSYFLLTSCQKSLLTWNCLGRQSRSASAFQQGDLYTVYISRVFFTLFLFNFKLQQTRILAKGRKKVELAVRVKVHSTAHDRKFTAEWLTNGTSKLLHVKPFILFWNITASNVT